VGTFVAADASAVTTSVTTLTGVTWPAHTIHDVAIVGWASDNTQTRTEPPTGFTSEFTNADGSLRAIVASLDTTGSESGDVSLVCGGANRQAGVLALYRGYDPNITNVTSQPETSGTNVTSHNSPSITPANGNSAIVLIYMDRVTTSVIPTAPAGYQVRGSFATSGSGGVTVVVADKLGGLTGGVPESPAAWTGATTSTTAYVIAMELVPLPASLAAAGDLTATATLTGAATAAKSINGDRTATATLAGAASLAISAVGSLAAAATLTGAATGTKPGLGDLAATALLTGAATVAKPASGNMSAIADLTGSASVTSDLSATGDLSATATLSGSALVDHRASGDLTAAALLTGAGEASKGASGDISAGATLAGSALILKPATGNLVATATLTGSAEVFPHFDPALRTTATARRAAASATIRANSSATAGRPSATATVRSPA